MSQIRTWFRGLRGRLLISSFLPTLGFAILTWISVGNMNLLGGHLNNAYTNLIPNIDDLGQLTTERASIGYFMWAAYGEKDEKESGVFVEKAQQAFQRFKEAQERYESHSTDPEAEKNYAGVKDKKARFYELTAMMLQDLAKNTPEADAHALSYLSGGEWHKLSIEIRKTVQTNTRLYRELAVKGDADQVATRKAKVQLMIGISIFGSLIIFGLLTLVAHRVSSSIGQISTQLSESGNLVAGAIEQLSRAGQNLSSSAANSAASLEETVASLEEMSSMVKMNSDNARQAATLSQSSKDAAEEGQLEIKSLIDSMHDISQSSHKIEEIISLIDDIAFQTNLLALNAAVEAARAGEQGKGFAVVAEAVRTLAQRSAAAAKDINGLIKDSSSKVERGSHIADKSGEVLNTIVTSVKRVSDLNNEISAASTEQTTGIQQISKAMNMLDEGTQSNAASSEEIAASSEEISTQASEMKTLVDQLNGVIFGNSEASPAPKATPSLKGQTAPKSHAGKVVKFKTPQKVEKKQQNIPPAAATIPFDEDDGELRKVGTTDGF